jgi:hypothetical protein
MPGSGDIADGLTRRAATASVWQASVSATTRETPAAHEPQSSRRTLTSRLLCRADASVRLPRDLALGLRPEGARAASGSGRLLLALRSSVVSGLYNGQLQRGAYKSAAEYYEQDGQLCLEAIEHDKGAGGQDRRGHVNDALVEDLDGHGCD